MSRAEPRTLLEQLVAASSFTWHELEEEFARRARARGDSVSLSWRQLQRIAAGDIARPRPAVARVLSDMFEHPIGDLLGPPEPTEPSVTMSEQVAFNADVQRRAFLASVAAASLGAAAPEPLARLFQDLSTVPPHHVGAAEVAAVEAAADAYMSFDLARSREVATEMARSALRWATELQKQQMTDPNRERLFSAIGLLADRVGWSIYDTGATTAAARMLTFALDHAARGTDRDLRAHVMLDLSTVMTDAGQPGDGVDVLRAALGDERISAAERADLHAVCARHCASAGERESGMRHAGMAEEALQRNLAVDGPEWARRITYAPGHHDSALGLALFALGDDSRARYHLGTALGTLDRGRTRTGLRCRIRLAVLDFREGDRTGGTAEGHRIIADAAGVQSTRIRSDLEMLRAQAERHGAHDLALDLTPLLI